LERWRAVGLGTLNTDAPFAANMDAADPMPRGGGKTKLGRQTPMPMPSIHRAVTIAAATMIAGAALLVHPASAASGDRQLAQASPPPSSAKTAPAAKPAARRPAGAEFVEARIKSLHDQLQITAAEEPQWNAVAEVMRDNAKAISALIAERAKNTKTMSAIDNLRSYQAIAKAHLDGINKLIPAFEALYAVMPEAQKKTADIVFSRRPTRPEQKKSG
jgi:periplasmic protein CpxP/Spy